MPGTSDLPAYRWTVVFASALILAVSMGSIVNGMSAFVIPMQDAYGWEPMDGLNVRAIEFLNYDGSNYSSMGLGGLSDKPG